MKLFLLLCCILASIFVYSNAFVQPASFRTGVKDTRVINLQQPFISSSSTYISTSHTSSLLELSPWDKDDDDNVNVQEIEVDAFTLTWYVYRISRKPFIVYMCHFLFFSHHSLFSLYNLSVYHSVGFGLIAFNFLVLGNMGDMGVGGVIARIMNTFG